jgi:hypothetical protein
MLKGVLLKGYGGFYYVLAQGDLWECSLRGRFRLSLSGNRHRQSAVAPTPRPYQESEKLAVLNAADQRALTR